MQRSSVMRKCSKNRCGAVLPNRTLCMIVTRMERDAGLRSASDGYSEMLIDWTRWLVGMRYRVNFWLADWLVSWRLFVYDLLRETKNGNMKSPTYPERQRKTWHKSQILLRQLVSPFLHQRARPLVTVLLIMLITYYAGGSELIVDFHSTSKARTARNVLKGKVEVRE